MNFRLFVIDTVKNPFIKLRKFQRALSCYKIESANCFVALHTASKYLNQPNTIVQESSANANSQAAGDIVSVQEIENARKAWQKTVNDLTTPKQHNGPV